MSQLGRIDSKLLMFLRKLRQLTLHGPDLQMTFKAHEDTANAAFGGEIMSISTRNNISGYWTVTKYIVVRQAVTNLPSDQRRQGQTQSEVVLAFPVLSGSSVEAPVQQVYAFLPIDWFGFRVRQAYSHAAITSTYTPADSFLCSFLSMPISCAGPAGGAGGAAARGTEHYGAH